MSIFIWGVENGWNHIGYQIEGGWYVKIEVRWESRMTEISAQQRYPLFDDEGFKHYTNRAHLNHFFWYEQEKGESPHQQKQNKIWI